MPEATTDRAPRFRPVTLALGGGGARGLAHLGVIERLERVGVPIARIVGTSIGSLAGSVYAFHPKIEDVQRDVLTYLASPGFLQHQERLLRAQQRGDGPKSTFFGWYQKVRDILKAGNFFRRVMSHRSLLPGTVLNHVSETLLQDVDISRSTIPLSVVAIDLNSGHRVVMEDGPVRDAVRASSSLPGIFPPVRVGGHLLCDAGTACALPSWIARSYGDPVIAVDVSAPSLPAGDCQSAFDVLVRMNEIAEVLFRRQAAAEAEILIRPEVSETPWFDFTNAHPLFEAGRRAADSVMNTITQKLLIQPPDSWQI